MFFQAICVICLFWVVIFIALFAGVNFDLYGLAIYSSEIRKMSHLNIFGSILICLLWIIINPLFFVARFLYWITHVKRNDDK